MKLSLKIKIISSTVALILLMAAIFAVFLRTTVYSTLEEEIDKRAFSIGRHFAELAAEVYLTESTSVLQTHLADYIATESYLAYIVILDGDKEVAAHTYKNAVPNEILTEINRPDTKKPIYIYQLKNGKTLEDFYIPIGTGRDGSVHVGIYEEKISGAIHTLIRRLLPFIILILFLGICGAFALATAIMRPIEKLLLGVRRVTRGDLNVNIEVRHLDEIGHLADAFNQMTENLRHITVSREFMDNLVNSMNDSLLVISPDGVIQSVNRAFCDLFGYTTFEVIGHKVGEFDDQDAPRCMFSAFEQTLRSDRLTGIEIISRTVSGKRITLLCSLAVMRDDEGKPLAVICAAQDISSIKLVQEQLQEKQQELSSLNQNLETIVSSRTAELAITNEGLRAEVAERMRTAEELKIARDAAEAASRAKSDFLANMSHEMRTPLNSIIGGTELIDDPRLIPEQRRCLEMIRQAGDSLLVQVNDLIDLARIEAGHLELQCREFMLMEMLEKVVQLLMEDAKRKLIELTLQLPQDLPRIMTGDRARLQQILVNLLGNAIKFTASGGRVTISVHSENHSDGKTDITFAVQDTGIGIETDKISLIFDPFAQADTSITRRYGGSGLGLSISKRLVEAMGSELVVESVPGVGSSFSFTISYVLLSDADLDNISDSESSEERGGVPNSAAPDLAAEAPRILLVDDSLENRELLRLLLSRQHLSLNEAGDGNEAVVMFEKGNYSLILMDIQMPVMDGYTATRRIREIEERDGRTPVPIIALTAHAYESDIRKCLEAGCDEHFAKPFKKKALLQCIARHLEGIIV